MKQSKSGNGAFDKFIGNAPVVLRILGSRPPGFPTACESEPDLICPLISVGLERFDPETVAFGRRVITCILTTMLEEFMRLCLTAFVELSGPKPNFGTVELVFALFMLKTDCG